MEINRRDELINKFQKLFTDGICTDIVIKGEAHACGSSTLERLYELLAKKRITIYPWRDVKLQFLIKPGGTLIVSCTYTDTIFCAEDGGTESRPVRMLIISHPDDPE